MQNEIITIQEPASKQYPKSETSKGHGLSTDNDCSQELSITQDQIDIFDCSISATETEQSADIEETIQLPNIASFQSSVD